MAETLKERKQSQSKKGNNSFSNTNTSNWKAYGSGVLSSIINIVVLCILGFGFLYSIKHLGYEKYLPTDITKMPYNPPKNMPFSKSIPYVPYKSTDTSLGGSLSQILAASMSQVRSLLQLIFKSISHLNESNTLSFIDYIFFVLSIFIIPILSIILPWGGILGGVLQWWNLKTGIFIKIAAFFLMGIVLLGTYLYQHIYPLIFTVFAVYQMKQDNMLGYYAKQMKHFIYFLIMAAIIMPAFGTLWYPFIIGMVVAAFIPYISTIIGLIL